MARPEWLKEFGPRPDIAQANVYEIIHYMRQLEQVITRARIRRCTSCGWPGVLASIPNPGPGRQAEVGCHFCGEPNIVLGCKRTSNHPIGPIEVLE